MTRTIPALPLAIKHPPASLIAPDDPERDEKRAAWLNWRTNVLRHRVKRWMELEKNADLRPIEMALCKDPAYWLLMWGTIFEPRPQRDRAPDSPFLLYPFQIDTLDWFDQRLKSSGADADGIVSKSRDMGASWLMAAWALHGWLFRYPWQFRIVSWRADEVDAKNPDSVFWKIDYIFQRLPKWMQPKGFDPDLHRQKMYLGNPANGNVIGGQASTERAMRGGRATCIGYDEAAINKMFEESWASTSNVAPTRIAVSSEHLEFNDFFYRLRTGEGVDPDERPAVLELDYYLHPEHDEQWYADQKARLAAKPGAFEREVLRDPKAGDTTFVYAAAGDKHTVPVTYVPGAPLYVGIDPGHADETAVVWMQQQPDGRMKVLDAYQAKGKTASFWGTILRGTPYERRWSWDMNEPDKVVTRYREEDNHMVPYQEIVPAVVEIGKNPTEAEPDIWTYTQHEYDLMAWTKTLPKATFFGDVSGNNTLGASKDTVYTRLNKFGIVVNADRDKNGKARAWKMQARTFKGRQEALKELLPRMDFANTWGGKLALSAVQNYRWTPQDKPRVSEPRAPLHDSTSHLCSAIEYVAVNLYMRRQVGRAIDAMKATADQTAPLVYASMGVSRG